MPRQPRIEYENAFYHAMNRGRGRQDIFHDKRYYEAFLQTLAEACERFHVKIHAYCLMSNHYHLLIQTPNANISRAMRHINGVYTQRHNILKKTDGPLFRGRFKAIVVDEDSYLLSLSRYIHLNPIATIKPLVGRLEDYEWSSYPAYIGKVSAPFWLEQELTYTALGAKQHLKAYRQFVEKGNDEITEAFYSREKIGAVFGGEIFKEKLARKYQQVPVIEKPSIENIISVVAEVLDLPRKNLQQKQLGRPGINVARQFAMYCCQRYTDLSLSAIAKYFDLNGGASLGWSLNQIKKQVSAGDFDDEVKQVEALLLTKST